MSSSSSPFPKWPKPTHDTNGDYRVETALFESKLHKSKGQLYEHQSKLPHLPIPSISETLSILPSTVLPLAKTSSDVDDERTSFMKAVENFPAQADRLQLQERLLKRRNEEYKDSSWIQHWWNTGAYLQVRDPLIINVSYFYHFVMDPTLPIKTESSGPDLSIPRGAAILHQVAKFRKEVCSATLSPPFVGRKEKNTQKYLCNAAYKYMFHTCRIPQLHQDCVRMYDPSMHENSHCIVSYKGMFYAVDFVDPSTGEPLPLSILENRLKRVKELVKQQQQNVKLGWLTSWDRDSWAKARDTLLSVGGKDVEQALSRLESGAFMLCLDDEQPVSRNETALNLLHGTMNSGYNRWFDKSLQFIVTHNGQAGMNGEHSMMDGMPTTHLAGIVAGAQYQNIQSQQTIINEIDKNTGVTDIFEKCHDILSSSTDIQNLVQDAKTHFHTLTSAHSLQTKIFHGYGSNYIKSAKFSPDAYVQMAIQLATSRLFKEQAATYEATQVRVFLHGRTEVTRAVTLESEAFVKAMGPHSHVISSNNQAAESASKVDLLRKATTRHSLYTGQASKGFGVDRHLFGLSMCVKEGEPMPDLFNHPLYQRAKHWRVSTSHLTHPNFVNWGYGEVVPNGVGLSYSIQKDYCNFCVVSLKEHEWSEKLGDLLEDALLEMRSIIDMDSEKGSVLRRSKL